MKIDSNFDIIWQKTYGGNDYEDGYSIQQTLDGGYIVAAMTYSFGAGKSDFWVFKLDSDGNVTWQKTYGGSDYERHSSIQQTNDHGYIITGYTTSFGDNVNILILKLDSNGTPLWQKIYSGSTSGGNVLQTMDGGYIITGSTYSLGGSNAAMLILKVDSNGDIPGCDIIGTSNIIVTDTMVTGLPSNCIIQDASYSLTGDNTFAFQPTSRETSSACCYDTDDNDFDCIVINEDNCPNHYNPDQVDSDGDGTGDACDTVSAPIPTLSEWGMIIFMTIILGIGVVILSRRRMV